MLRPKFPEITLVIQGKFSECATSEQKYLTYQRYFKDIIVSTWDNEGFAGPVIQSIASDYVIKRIDEYTWKCTENNLAAHVWSTLNGLLLVKTPYAIKIRGDEYREKLDTFCKKVVTLDKFICDNCHFIKNSIQKFHVGDHTIGSSTSNMLRMFGLLESKLDLLKSRGFSPTVFSIDDESLLPVHSMFGIAGALTKTPYVTMGNSAKHIMDHFDVVPVHEMGKGVIHSNAISFGSPSEFYAKFPGNINEIGEVLT